MKILLSAALLALAPAVALAQTPADDFARGRELRLAGKAPEAVVLLERAAEGLPNDADVWLNLGLALIAAHRFDAAEDALNHALRLAPDYADVQLARARLAFFRHDLDEADRRVERLLQQAPDNAEALQLKTQLAGARADTATPWRLDVATSRARLSSGLPDSTGAVLALSRSLSAGGAAGASLDYIRQFGRTDVYLEAVRSGAWGYVAVGGAPDADFRPEVALRGGLAGPRWRMGDGWTAQLSVDGAWSRYPVGDVRALHPVLALSRGEGLRLQARWINVVDERDDYRSGYALGADWQAAAWLRLSVGWADAPESSEGVTMPVQATSLGAAIQLTPRTTLRLGGAHEARSIYDRDEVSLGLTQRF